jgi:hypothetical protein
VAGNVAGRAPWYPTQANRRLEWGTLDLWLGQREK